MPHLMLLPLTALAVLLNFNDDEHGGFLVSKFLDPHPMDRTRACRQPTRLGSMSIEMLVLQLHNVHYKRVDHITYLISEWNRQASGTLNKI